MKKELHSNYNDLGFIVLKKLLSANEIIGIQQYINSLQPRIFLPDGSTPWGYGNLVGSQEVNFIFKKPKLVRVLNSILPDKYKFNHLLINNKSRWFGPPVEWHQEFSLLNTFAPGYTVDELSKFVQVYIALDKHTISNGCLTIFPGSHKLGLLNHQDIIGYNLNHKKQLTLDVLDSLQKSHPPIDIPMEEGDCLVFNHLLVHGSGSNNTGKDRKAIIIQARVDDKEIDKGIFSQYSLFRLQFAINYFKNKIKQLSSNNLYKDFVNEGKTNT